MDPLLFSAPFRHWRDPTVGLHFFCVGVTLPLRAKRGQQAWRGNRLLDSFHPALDQFSIATAVLAEERAQRPPIRRDTLLIPKH